MKLLFYLGMIGKGLDSLLEVMGGIILLSPFQVDRIASWLTQHELHIIFRHPTMARVEHATVLALGKASVVGAIYLIVHGSAKVVLIVAALRGKKWGFSGLIVVLSLFAVIELVHAAMHRTWPAAVFGLGDIVLVWVIWREMKREEQRS